MTDEKQKLEILMGVQEELASAGESKYMISWKRKGTDELPSVLESKSLLDLVFGPGKEAIDDAEFPEINNMYKTASIIKDTSQKSVRLQRNLSSFELWSFENRLREDIENRKRWKDVRFRDTEVRRYSY